MAKDFKITSDFAAVLLTGAIADLNGGTLTVYDDGNAGASIPANAADSHPGTAVVLAEIPLDTPSFSVSGNVLTLDVTGTEDTSANASGTAFYFRVKTSGGTERFQGTVGNGTFDLNLANTSITAGGIVKVVATSTLTLPLG